MKQCSRIYRWIAVSLFLQLVVLFYINNIFLGSREEIRITSLTAIGGLAAEKEADIPLGASGVQLSHSVEFAAYMVEQELDIISLSDGKKQKVPVGDGEKITLYRWLPDRNMLLCSAAPAGKDGDWVRVFSYEADTRLVREYPAITGLPGGSVISEIEFSTLTNTVYAKVKLNSSKARVYKYDIMNNLDVCFETAPETPIRELNLEDLLVYETGNRLYVYNGNTGTSKLLPVKGNLVLLGIDKQDRLYGGFLNSDGKVESIAAAPVGEWSAGTVKPFKLTLSVLPEQIQVTPGGEVIWMDWSGKTLTELPAGEKTIYEGELVQLLESRYAVRNGSRLQVKFMD
jgi:hypothetical protein